VTRSSLRAGVAAFSLAVVALPGTAFAGGIGENNVTLSERLHL
jgi:hypothetical protein